MARSNYSFKKRQKELARKKKKEQKRQRKLDKDTNIPEETSDQSQDAKIDELVKSQKSPSPLMGEGRGEGE